MTVSRAPEAVALDVVEQSGNRMVLSMGPQHPSTHGVLQVITEIDGETVTKASPEIGYLHTGIEKSAENLFWSQASTVIERMDYLSPLTNALCYYLAVEQLLGPDAAVPPVLTVVLVTPQVTSPCVVSVVRLTVKSFVSLSANCSKPPAVRACIRTTCASAASRRICPTVFWAASTP